MKDIGIVIVGVGGQGTLLASRILGALAKIKGKDVKVSEVHGMSQRGGSVITYVRIGNDVRSPLVEMGEADYVLAFERAEALRALPYLKAEGTLIANDQMILPMPVIIGSAKYPEDALDTLRDTCDLVPLDAAKLAKEAGEARAVNLVLMGVLCKRLGESKKDFLEAIRACVAERFIEANVRAFEAGYLAV